MTFQSISRNGVCSIRFVECMFFHLALPNYFDGRLALDSYAFQFVVLNTSLGFVGLNFLS